MLFEALVVGGLLYAIGKGSSDSSEEPKELTPEQIERNQKIENAIGKAGHFMANAADYIAKNADKKYKNGQMSTEEYLNVQEKYDKVQNDPLYRQFKDYK